MYKEPKDGDVRLKHCEVNVCKTFSKNETKDKYILQRYHSSNGWADLPTEEDYIFIRV